MESGINDTVIGDIKDWIVHRCGVVSEKRISSSVQKVVDALWCVRYTTRGVIYPPRKIEEQ